MASKIAFELMPFTQFKYSENPSEFVRYVTGPDGRERTERAYENCIACNAQGLTLKERSNIPNVCQTEQLFCDPCKEKVQRIKDKYYQEGEGQKFELYVTDFFYSHRAKL